MDSFMLSIIIGVSVIAAIILIITAISCVGSKEKREPVKPSPVAICVGCSIHPPPPQPCAIEEFYGLRSNYGTELVSPGKLDGGGAHEPSFEPANFKEEGAEEVEMVTFGQPAKITGVGETTTKPVTREYEYYPMLDSFGSDVAQLPSLAGNVGELKAACDSFPNCQAFNTKGHLKYTVDPTNEWAIYSGDPRQGLYVLKGMAR